MKKNFPLGNWFPAEVVVTKFEGHTESATERTNKQPLVSYPFEITIGKGEGSGNTATKILVAGGMVNEYEVEKVEFAKNDSTELIYLKCELGSMPDQDITSATIENQQPHNSETEAFTLIGRLSWSDSGQLLRINQYRRESVGLVSCTDSHMFYNM